MQTEILNLDPSDVLVLRTPAYLHATQRESVIADIKAQLGAGAKVIVLDGGLDVQVLRPAATARVHEEPEPVMPARIANADVAQGYETYRKLGVAPDQLRNIDLLRKEFDSADRDKRAGRGRLQYVIDRARELDAEDAALAECEDAAQPAIPKYRWVHEACLEDGQKAFAISHDEKHYCYAIREEDLTDRQKRDVSPISMWTDAPAVGL